MIYLSLLCMTCDQVCITHHCTQDHCEAYIINRCTTNHCAVCTMHSFLLGHLECAPHTITQCIIVKSSLCTVARWTNVQCATYIITPWTIVQSAQHTTDKYMFPQCASRTDAHWTIVQCAPKTIAHLTIVQSAYNITMHFDHYREQFQLKTAPHHPTTNNSLCGAMCIIHHF